MMAPGALAIRRMGADLLESAFELEHPNIEFAKTSRVSNDIEPSDLVVHEGEYYCLGQFAGFVLAKQPPAKQLLNLAAYDTSFEIPPYVETVTLVYLQPHMHLRGTNMEIEATHPDGRSEMLVSVPRYNFQWQVIYMLEKPIKLPKGTRIDVFATWDNSANNKSNPDPSSTVRTGQQSWDEMLVALLGVTVDRGIDPGRILTLWWNIH